MSDLYSDWIGDDQPYTDDSFDRFVDVCWEQDSIELTDADLDWPETVIER